MLSRNVSVSTGCSGGKVGAAVVGAGVGGGCVGEAEVVAVVDGPVYGCVGDRVSKKPLGHSPAAVGLMVGNKVGEMADDTVGEVVSDTVVRATVVAIVDATVTLLLSCLSRCCRRRRAVQAPQVRAQFRRI